MRFLFIFFIKADLIIFPEFRNDWMRIQAPGHFSQRQRASRVIVVRRDLIRGEIEWIYIYLFYWTTYENPSRFRRFPISVIIIFVYRVQIESNRFAHLIHIVIRVMYDNIGGLLSRHNRKQYSSSAQDFIPCNAAEEI